LAWQSYPIDFGDGRLRTCITVPWGDVSTAHASTGIPNITVYAPAKARTIALLRALRPLVPLLRLAIVQRVCAIAIHRGGPGPSEDVSKQRGSLVWGEVADDAGVVLARARLTLPPPYPLTATTAVMAAQRVLAGRVAPGFATPSIAFGSDFVLDVAGTALDVLPTGALPNSIPGLQAGVHPPRGTARSV
jgi:short subunit dehydrogenase-like uncharacterized protein